MTRQTVWQRLISWWGRPNDDMTVNRLKPDANGRKGAQSDVGPMSGWTKSGHESLAGLPKRGSEASAQRAVFDGGGGLAGLAGHSGSGVTSTAESVEFSERVLDEYGIEDELRDFMAADLDPVAADPKFREDLRERLWALVQDGVIARPRNH